MKATLSSFLTAALLLSMAACNQNQSASTGAAPRALATATPGKDSGLSDACQFLTRAEAESVLSEPVRDPEPSTFGGAHICDYKTVAVHGGVLPYSVHIAVIPEQQQVWDAGKKLYGHQMRPVPGIGDDAYFLLDDLLVLTHQRSEKH